MVRDNVKLHTLAGCSRDSVVALLGKYSPTDSHCELSMVSSCVVKRWFWLYFSNLCQAVWPSIRSIHSLIVCPLYVFIVCPICTASITIFILFLLYIFPFIVLCVFLYFIITAALCVLINGMEWKICCLAYCGLFTELPRLQMYIFWRSYQLIGSCYHQLSVFWLQSQAFLSPSSIIWYQPKGDN